MKSDTLIYSHSKPHHPTTLQLSRNARLQQTSQFYATKVKCCFISYPMASTIPKKYTEAIGAQSATLSRQPISAHSASFALHSHTTAFLTEISSALFTTGNKPTNKDKPRTPQQNQKNQPTTPSPRRNNTFPPPKKTKPPSASSPKVALQNNSPFNPIHHRKHNPPRMMVSLFRITLTSTPKPLPPLTPYIASPIYAYVPPCCSAIGRRRWFG